MPNIPPSMVKMYGSSSRDLNLATPPAEIAHPAPLHIGNTFVYEAEARSPYFGAQQPFVIHRQLEVQTKKSKLLIACTPHKYCGMAKRHFSFEQTCVTP